MAQELKTEQRLSTGQYVSGQQMLTAKLLESPLGQFEDLVRDAMHENEALMGSDPASEEGETSNTEQAHETIDSILSDREDDEPTSGGMRAAGGGYEPVDIPLGSDTSFNEYLTEQIGEYALTDKQRTIIEYMIGSLNGKGYLEKDLLTIEDELAFNHNIITNGQELEEALHILQSFEPTGIGARDMQECLLLQLRSQSDTWERNVAQKLIADHFDDFKNHHWEQLPSQLGITQDEFYDIYKHIKRLNPAPGSALGESMSHGEGRVMPDFSVTVDDYGDVSVELNWGNVPSLYISESYLQTMEDYSNNKSKMSLQQKEGIAYTKQKVESARGFIEAVNTRRKTMLSIMKAIVKFQMQFFQSNYFDRTDLRPMRLRDIEELTHYDKSTISRVVRDKYVEINHQKSMPLKDFFSSELEYAVEEALREIVDAEDKRHPLSDEKIKDILQQKGMAIERRTVAKYREKLKIPVARLRKTI